MKHSALFRSGDCEVLVEVRGISVQREERFIDVAPDG